MVRNILFVTRHFKNQTYPKVTIYLNDKEIGIMNMIGNRDLPPDIDRTEFKKSALQIIIKELPMLTAEEIDVVRDFLIH